MSLQFPSHLLTYIISIITLLAVVLVGLQRRLLNQNVEKRSRLLAEPGLVEASNFGGTDNEEGGNDDRKIAGFLHPYCNAGGGGERVLWTAIAYLQRTDPNVISVVYTGDIDPKTGLPLQKDRIIQRTKERFGITLDGSKLHFIHLKWRWLIEDTTWKRFTMLGQGLGTALLAVEAMYNLVPDVFLDTHGLAFSYPIVRFLTNTSSFSIETGNKKLPIVAYIHYPTISASMLHRISTRQANYANDSEVTNSSWRSMAKLLYYRLYSYVYTSALLASPPTILTVNSSWTRAHVESLLAARTPLPFPISLIPTILGYNMPLPQRINEPPLQDENAPASELNDGRVKTIYPPCDVSVMENFSLEGRKQVIFGCAQFRPEKDHAKQLIALALLLQSHPEFRKKRLGQSSKTLSGSTSDVVIVDHSDVQQTSKKGFEPVQLVLLGSARHQEDLDRVEELKRLAKQLKVEDQVTFVLNAPYEELLGWLSRSSIGISTMVEEHFGIGVVEFMGAGLIPVVHASGGPIMDIVTPFEGERTGFFADSAEEFANQLYLALTLSEQESLAMRQRARLSSKRFSVAAFEKGFGEVWKEVKEWVS